MLDFLTFQSFISLPALFIFYYLGALILPIITWYLCLQLSQKLNIIHLSLKKGQQWMWQLLNTKQKSMLTLFFILMLGFIELFWRMIFEFLIAYMQMHNALEKP
ncbi:DUF4282 domain-containing protein [Ghiorsea bivora]|uniref:DUF4282 domain-containing protein n=1 Tax=Ghiorsea bivora TaxID=1485545 RepID=UPI0005720989|nr:DUF4282 domain-containing protein [Ghiorsea bivora]